MKKLSVLFMLSLMVIAISCKKDEKLHHHDMDSLIDSIQSVDSIAEGAEDTIKVANSSGLSESLLVEIFSSEEKPEEVRLLDEENMAQKLRGAGYSAMILEEASQAQAPAELLNASKFSDAGETSVRKIMKSNAMEVVIKFCNEEERDQFLLTLNDAGYNKNGKTWRHPKSNKNATLTAEEAGLTVTLSNINSDYPGVNLKNKDKKSADSAKKKK